jgi:hypothetical protein
LESLPVAFKDAVKGPIVFGTAQGQHLVGVGHIPPRTGALEADMTDELVGRFNSGLSWNSRDRPQNGVRSAGTEELNSIQVEREPAEEASDMEPITGVPGKLEGLRVVGARFCDLQIRFHLKLLVYGDSKSSFYLPLLTPQFCLLPIVIPSH